MPNQHMAPRRSTAFAVSAVLATLAGAALAACAGRSVDAVDSGPLGLIQALPLLYFVGLAILMLSFVATVRRANLIRPLLVLQLFLLIVLLYGLASFVETVARLPTTWVHVGFIDYIQRTDSVLENYDARFVWPGFFALGAMLNELGGITDQSAIATWAPLVFNLAYAVPVWTIVRAAGAPIRACWLATAMFFLLNWVGQDYYSPQGLNELFALCFLAVLMRVFFSQAAIVPAWAQSTIQPFIVRRFPRLSDRIAGLRLQAGGPARLAITGPQKAGLVGALIILYGASIVSHQLTPFFLIILTVALVILDRLNIRVLPVVMIVGVFVWISYAATSFWAGQLSQLFGDVGKVGNVVGQNVGDRVTGDPAHLPVIWGRLALAGGVWLLAFVGFLRRTRHGRLDILCVIGFLAPFSILGGQAYGGEAVLRVYLYGLPFAAALGAMALAPANKAWSKATTTLVSVVLVGLLPVFFITRYGNEAFENFTSDEFAVVQKAYELAPDGSKLYSLNSLLPWRGERIEHVQTESVADPGNPDDLTEAVKEKLLDHPDGQPNFLLLTRAQTQYGAITQGRPLDALERISDQLIATGQFRIVYENPEGSIIVPLNQP